MSNFRRNIIILILLPAFVVACNRRPDNVLSESETIDLLADLQLAEAYTSVRDPGVKNISPQDLSKGILAAHGVTQEQFDATLEYYGENIDEYYLLFDKVSKRLEKKRAQISGAGAEEIEGDNIWPYYPFTLISNNALTKGLKFSIGAQGVNSGEILEWKMRLNQPVPVNMLLGIEYNDGSSSYIKRNGGGSKSMSLSLQTDSARIGKRIFGYMTIDRNQMPLWVDSISLQILPFDSLKYSKINIQQKLFKPLSKTLKEREENEAPELQNSETMEGSGMTETMKVNS